MPEEKNKNEEINHVSLSDELSIKNEDDNLDNEVSSGDIQDKKRKLHFWIFMNFAFLSLVVVLIFLVYNFAKNDEVVVDSREDVVDNIVEAELARRQLDGVMVKKGSENLFPLAVMIDNHTDARPPSSLNKAGLVIEAEAEGGITRYLAFFATDENLEEIGPVRSARPYFIDWAKGVSALYTHVGGSPDGLVKIAKENVVAINEFYQGEYFWRGNDNFAPHNVFTSSENLYKFLEKKELTEGKFFSWKYKDELKREERPVSQTIKIDYILKDFTVEWGYDVENNNYIRKIGGVFHKEKSGDIITAKNIIIQYTEAEEVDDKLRLDMNVIGEGKVIICRDGKCEEGKWKKKTSSSRTRFYDINDEEVELNPGKTWIEVVRGGCNVEY